MGELGAFDTRPGVVIGERLRQALGLRIGDKLTVTTQRLNEQGTIAPRYADYEILASFLTKRYEFDNALVFVPLQMLQDDLEYDHRTVSSIDLDLSDPNLAPKVADTIRKTLHRDDLKVSDWQALNARFVGALQVERVMMFIILTLIVLVAAMNVVASFTMLVRVKRGSIAILRTMGAAPGTIVRAFFMSAAAVGIVGTAVGTGLGLLVCANIAGDRRLLRPAGRRPQRQLGRDRVHHFGAGARESERGADRDRDRPGAVARGGGLSGVAQHADRTGRGLAQ